MGCLPSKNAGQSGPGKVSKPDHWKSEIPLTTTELQRQRDEFWHTAPAYGGDKVIWDALKAAVESDASTAAIILDSAGVTHNSDLSECYDERGRKYELPQYVLSEPSNLIRDKPAGSQVELMAR